MLFYVHKLSLSGPMNKCFLYNVNPMYDSCMECMIFPFQGTDISVRMCVTLDHVAPVMVTLS